MLLYHTVLVDGKSIALQYPPMSIYLEVLPTLLHFFPSLKPLEATIAPPCIEPS